MTYRRGPWPALGGPRSAEEGSPRPAVRGPWPTEWAPGLQTRIFSTLLYHKIKNQAGFEKIYFDLYISTTDHIMQEYSIAKNCKPLYVRQNDQCFHRMKQNKKSSRAAQKHSRLDYNDHKTDWNSNASLWPNLHQTGAQIKQDRRHNEDDQTRHF